MTKHNLLLFLLFFIGITQRAIAQEAYAALSEDNTVLTFYYDNYKKARNGMSVGPFSSVANHKVTGREWNEYISSITRVVFDATFAEYRPTSTVYWFYECGVLTTITGIENLKTDNLTDVGGMFYGCSSITNLDLSSFNTSNVKYMDNMFYGCSGLTSLDVSNFNTNNVVNMGQMFFGCSSLTNLNVSYFNTSSVTNMNSMFNGCSSLTSLDVSKFNTEEVKDMSSLFSGCSSLTSLDLSHFNTKSVTDMRGMFSGCSGLTSLDVSNFNTSNVVIMGQMFLGCSGLISLNVSNFNTRNVTNMNGMFSGCSSLTDLDVSDFDTGNVTEMAGMFHNCSGLNKLDLSHFHTENVTDMRNMFSGCSNLTIHDLSNFKTNKVKYMNSMFLDCSGLKTIKINADNWVTSNVTMSEQMFFGCTSLVGGKGTAYNTNYVDKAYAHIDGGITYPGYFTDTDPASIHSPLLLKDLSSTCNTIKGRTTTLSFVAAYATSYQWYFASSNIASPDNDTAIEGAISPSYTYNATDIGMEHVYCVASNDKGSIISNICTIRVNSKEIFSWESPRGIPVLIGGLNTGPSNGDRVNYASTWNDITYYTICLVGKKADVDTDKYIELTPIQPFAAGDVIEVTGYYNKSYEMTVSMFFKYSNGTVVEDDTNLANIQGGVENIKTYTFIVPAEAAGSTSVRLTRNIAATNIYITKLVMANSKGDESTNTKYIAEYDDKTHVLTFKEGLLISGESNVFDTADTGKQPGWNTYASEITSVSIEKSFAGARPASCRRWFSGLEHINMINGIEYLNTENVIDMSEMFHGCSNLTNLDLSNFNTSKVMDMGYMFAGCSSLTSLDVSNFNTDNVTSMSSMFSDCSSLTSLDLCNFNTSNVTDMSSMFYGCIKLKTIFADEGWNTKAVKSSSNMFANCTELVGGLGTTYDASHTDVSYARIDGRPDAPGYITDVNATQIPEAYAALSDNNTVLTFYYDGYKESRNGMSVGPFNEASYAAGEYNVSGRGWNTAPITKVVFDTTFADYRPASTAYWFYGCKYLIAIEGMENLVTENVNDMTYMFSSCFDLSSLDVHNFNTENVLYMGGLFRNCCSLTSIDVSKFNTNKVTDMSSMFFKCSALTHLDLHNFNTSNVTDVNCMFASCSDLTNLDVSNFNTENVTNMCGMFSNCSGLTNLDVSNFNTSKVTDMSKMFLVCGSLTSLDLSNFNTSKVTDMNYMFDGCSGLTSLDLSNFNTNKLTDMSYMFRGCSSLTYLDVSNFNTSNVTSMVGMFDCCYSLASLDLSNFNTSNVTKMTSMFKDCSSLKIIKVNTDNWNIVNVPTGIQMFEGCTNLVGGKGTTYDANHVDAAYAHVDGGTSNPGYLTDVNVPQDNVTIYAKNYTREYGEDNPAFEYDVTEGTITDGTPELSSGATAASPVGTYDIVISKGGVTNNEVSLVNGTLTITKAPLTISCGDYTIMQGEVLPEFALEYNGWKNDETEDVLTTKPTVTCEASKDSEPGTYDIIVSGAEAQNYEISYVAGKLTVTARKDNVTLTAKSYTREYGEANPAFEYDVTEGTITNGTPELSSEATATSPVGTYDIVISKGSVTNNEVSLVNGTLTITKAPLTISCGDYTITQGEALPEFALEYSGWKNNETVDVLTTKPTVTCEATSNSEPGTYDIVVRDAEAENYEISYVAGTLTIEAKPIVIEPVEVETEMKTEALSGQDLSNNVVNDVYYNVGSDSYDASDKSIVISQTTNMSQIADKQPGSADVKENFNGMILKVAKGKGLITVNVKTSGNAQLVVQVGNGTPMLASKTEKGDVVFSYDVEEDTYVYIYAIIGSSAAKGYGLNAADTDGSVRIYGITVSPGATGIRSIGASEKNDGNIYDLQGHRVETPAKGIYIIGGRKVAVK